MSPARTAKSLPVMPNIVPPLSVYLRIVRTVSYNLCDHLTGRMNVLCCPSCYCEVLRRRNMLAGPITADLQLSMTPS